MTENGTGSRKKHRWLKWFGGSLLALFLIVSAVVAVSLHKIEPTLRTVIVEKLSEHFHSHVELDSFHITVANGLWAEGKGLRIWPPAPVSSDGTNGNAMPDPGLTSPLIQLEEFRFHTPLEYTRGKPIHISQVTLRGLNIDIPPKSHFAHPAAKSEPSADSPMASLFHFVVQTIVCTDAHLTLETDKPDRLPLVFNIQSVKVTGVSMRQPMHFNAQLTNPKPQGEILTSGTIGPLKPEDPGELPITGHYQFEHADLGVFKGIAGIMESTGDYAGVLRELTVDGTTSVPDFRLTNFNSPLPLKTHFHAFVDGTNGDTRLQDVDAMLGKSHFTTAGEIIRQQAQVVDGKTRRPSGHEIALKVYVDKGRIEDFIRLASKSNQSVMTGDVVVKSTIEIPPGTEHVEKRLKLKGTFTLDNTQFTSDNVQDKIRQLSLRGQGDANAAKNGGGGDVSSSMQSDFTMGNGIITLPNLQYTVPGAEIDMKGTYGVDGGALDFRGVARMDATVSKMVGGWKGFLLKPADHFFKKDGAGTEVPIRVSGTRESPHFGLEFKHFKKTEPETPGN